MSGHYVALLIISAIYEMSRAKNISLVAISTRYIQLRQYNRIEKLSIY